MRFADTELLDQEDFELLKSFYMKRYQALGDILTAVNFRGSRTSECLRKLMEWGFIRKTFDWDHISEGDTIYYITSEGKDILKNNTKHI